ncbi:MAG TPA: hypothetical protein VK166_02405 [Chitinophagaceae bacterium]|nr:hypothetical protein [Chitinophagaceae bacterium]
MTAANTVKYFSYYLFLLALTLIFVPNVLLSVFQMPETSEVWIRVVGVLVACIAVYYHEMAKLNAVPFLKLTVWVRLFVFVAFTGLWISGAGPVQLILFGIVDALAAFWTWYNLKHS